MTRDAPARDRLRVAYVWRDDVMADTVVEPDGSVTLGTDPGCTFTIPELGLPPAFAIVEAGEAGRVLNLRRDMDGRVCLAGRTSDLGDLLRPGAELSDRAARAGDDFRTAIEPGDWGVVELDPDGEHTVFFQFVAAERRMPPAGWRAGELVAPALAFAVVLHAILLTITYLLQDEHNRFLFPGSRDLMTGYLVKRPPPPPPPEEPAPVADTAAQPVDEKPVAARTERDRRRPRAKSAPRAESAVPKKVMESGLLKHREALSDLGNRGFDKDLGKALSRLRDRSSTASGPGFGRPGGGDGAGPGTRGDPSGGEGGGDVIATHDIDTGGEREGGGERRTKPREVSVQMSSGTPTGDLGEITELEIDNVVKSRSGLYRSCYQKQLNRSPQLAGKLVVRFTIAPDGTVKSAKVLRDKSTLRNDEVEDCVLRHIQRLTFPAKGGALVNYPLFFSQG